MTIHIQRAISDVYPAAQSDQDAAPEAADNRWVLRQQYHDLKAQCEAITARLKAEDFED